MVSRERTIWLGAWLLLCCFCAAARADEHTIKIVSSLPRTGSAKGQTDSIVNGINMAFDEAHWQVGEFKIKYDDLDDATASAGAWTPERETANANLALQDSDVMVYLGPFNSNAAKISMPILNRAGVLMISSANTATGLTKPGKGDPGEPEIYRPKGKINYTRVVPADDLQGSLSAKWSRELGVSRVYVLDDSEVYGRGIAKQFAQTCEEIGIVVLGHESIDVNQQEFKTLMTKIRVLGPDLIYFGGTTQSKGDQIAKDMVSAGLTAKIMVPDGCYEEVFIKAAGAKNLEGRAFFTFGGVPPAQQVGPGKVFVDNYNAKFHVNPEAYAIYGYEAAKVAIEAIRIAGKKDRDAITTAAVNIKDFDQGALGKWSFDENGDTTLATMSGNTVKDGEFEFIKLLDDTTGQNAPPLTQEDAQLAKPDRSRVLLQFLLIGLTNGMLFALIALGYTMVYGIIELINFAHGDVFMLGACLALSLVGWLKLDDASTGTKIGGILLMLVVVAAFCAVVNLTIERLVYRPLRHAPKLVPLVSAIGVSFILMNIGQLWIGTYGRDFPSLVAPTNLANSSLIFTAKDLLVYGITLPIMIGLTLLVKFSKLGMAMRATAQNPVAARLMGVSVDRVIAATFLIGGALAGATSVIYCLFINTVNYQIGFQNGLYAFTAAVLGGIGNIPGAVLGGIVIGIVRALGSAYVGERWTSPLVFLILILILVFRPAGLLGARTREKV